MKFCLIIGLALAFCLGTPARSEIIPGQAVSWTDFSYITCLNVSQEFVYIGTTEGILRYHRFDLQWYPPLTVSDGLSDGYINNLAVPFDDSWIIVNTPSGIYEYDEALEEWTYHNEFPGEYAANFNPPRPLPDVLMPFKYYMAPEGYISDPYFRDYEVTAWLDDGFNNIYIGTWGWGMFKADNTILKADFFPYGLIQKSCIVIYREGDSLWLGGNAGDLEYGVTNNRQGVTLFELEEQNFSYLEPYLIPGFDSEIIFDIAGDSDNIYFAGYHGFTVRSRERERWFTLSASQNLPGTSATALAVGPDSVWVGSDRGLALYNPSADMLTEVGQSQLRDLFVTSLALQDSLLIIGTDQGSFYINTSTRKLGRLRDPENILNGEVRDIFVYGNEIFIATSWGVTAFNSQSGKAADVPWLTETNGAFAVAANDVYVAAAVDNGLMLIERDTRRSRVFDTNDGLLSIEIHDLLPDGDYLWVGSEKGLTRFKWINPDRID